MEAGAVTSDMLKLSLNPLKAKRLYGNRNYSELEDEDVDVDGKEQRGPQKEKGPKKEQRREPSLTETSYDALIGGQRDLLRNVAVHKAVSEGNRELGAEIEQGRLVDGDLVQFLGNGITVDDLHRFPKFSVLSAGLSVEAHHRLQLRSSAGDSPTDADEEDRESAGSARWNEEDGMTESIMSSRAADELRFLERLQRGLRPVGVSDERTQALAPARGKAELAVEHTKAIVDMIDTIDDLAERAKRLKLTKIGFIDCLREVTCRKIEGIKRAKELFECAIDKLAAAQEYELKNQQSQAIRVAQQVYLQKGREAMALFNTESHAIIREYHSLHSLIDFYKEQVATQNQKLAQQECIISKFQTHIGVCMRERVDRQILQLQLASRQSQPISTKHRPEDPDGEWTESKLFRHQFDLYGMNIRLQGSEVSRLKESRLVQEKDEEIEFLQERLEYLTNDFEQQGQLLQEETATVSRLKLEVDKL